MLTSAFQNFDSDISSVGIDGCWQADSQRILNEVMVEHFFRQGMLDVAEELCQVMTSTGVEWYQTENVTLYDGILIWMVVFQVNIEIVRKTAVELRIFFYSLPLFFRNPVYQ